MTEIGAAIAAMPIAAAAHVVLARIVYPRDPLDDAAPPPASDCSTLGLERAVTKQNIGAVLTFCAGATVIAG
jgi:hypothetical protein